MMKTREELNAYVWRRLGVRRIIAGRNTVNELIEAAIANWDHECLSSAKDSKEREIVANGIVLAMKRTHQMLGESGEEYGFVWIILLQALASAVVQILIKWWMESASNKVLLVAMKRELAG